MGTLSYLFAIFVSVFTSIIFVSAILYSDRKSKEPKYMIALALLSGIFTISLTLIIERFILPYLSYLNLSSYSFTRILVFAFIEEAIKLIVLFFFIQKNSNFDDIYDGFVYSSLIALSFASFETVMYVFSESDLTSMIHLAIIRGITTIPLHLICGIIMGYYVGTEKFSKTKTLKRLKIFNSLLFPTIVHTIYNYFLIKILSFVNSDMLFILLIVIFFIPLYIIGVIYINRTKIVNESFMNNKKTIGLLTNKEYKNIDSK